MAEFDLTLDHLVPGCAELCTSAAMWFVLEALEPGGTVILDWDNVGVPVTYTLGAADVGVKKPLPNVLLATVPITWNNGIHFSKPGNYKICWYVECTVGTCTPGKEAVASRCLEAKVYQWKDAGKILLDEKWNLVSLPLVPFDPSIANLIKSLPAEALDKDGTDDLVSIHYYDRSGVACVDPGVWKAYKLDGTQTSLTTMQDGNSYWVKLTYPITASPAYTWWVWGTALPMPPASPKQYPACTGWNMMGFTSLVSDDINDYLWNWVGKPYVVYGWLNTGIWTTSTWDYIDPSIPENLVTGQGYWAAFPTPGGFIYVPGPV